jgi:hypothetical protein
VPVETRLQIVLAVMSGEITIAEAARRHGVSTESINRWRNRFVYKAAFAGEDPLLRHVRTRVRSPRTNGVIERFFGTLKYEHLYRAPIDDGGALAMETARFRDIYNRIRPHQSLGDRTPRDAYLGITGGASV